MRAMLFALSAAALWLAAAAPAAQAVECRAGHERAGCVGPNGAAMTGPNGTKSTTSNGNNNNNGNNNYDSNQNNVTPGKSATGRRGNSATKAVQPGCAYVNGQRKCN